MKKKLVLKPFVIPTLYSIFAVVVIISLFLSIEVIDEKTQPTYVSDAILDEYVPVVNVEEVIEETIIRPFTDQTVIISNNYYDYQGAEEEQQASILYHENTYLQNTGINYKSENTFDVISILNGEVIEVEDKELLGKSVTIRHDNELISVYQSLGEVLVKKGDNVSTGQVIGKSGTCHLFTNSKNNLHFELYVNGTIADPENYYDKKLSDI